MHQDSPKSKNMDQKTKNNGGSHQANVCPVCNKIIYGTKPLHWVDKSLLRLEQNECRLSVERYHNFQYTTVKDELVQQYEVTGLKGLLLSPKSKINRIHSRLQELEVLMLQMQRMKRAEQPAPDLQRKPLLTCLHMDTCQTSSQFVDRTGRRIFLQWRN